MHVKIEILVTHHSRTSCHTVFMAVAQVHQLPQVPLDDSSQVVVPHCFDIYNEVWDDG